MKNISFSQFCEMLNVKKEDAVEQRKKYQDFDYIGPHLTNRIDHHLIFAAISISSLFNIKSLYEIGTCAGNCCRVLSLMFPKTQIKTLDLQTNADNDNAVRLLGPLENVEMKYHNSILLWQKEIQKYDCVFVDGTHWFPVVFSDILWGYFHTNEITVFHDVCKNKDDNQRSRPKSGTDVLECLEYLDSIIKEEIYIIDSDNFNMADIGVIIIDQNNRQEQC